MVGKLCFKSLPSLVAVFLQFFQKMGLFKKRFSSFGLGDKLEWILSMNQVLKLSITLDFMELTTRFLEKQATE